MREKCAAAIAQALQEVPEGTLAILQNGAQAVRDCHAGDQLTTQIVGKGRIERYRLYPGIELSYHQYLAEQVHFATALPTRCWRSTTPPGQNRLER